MFADEAVPAEEGALHQRVEDDEAAVRGHVQIDLDHVGSEGEGGFVRPDCVGRDVATPDAAVGDEKDAAFRGIFL